MTVLYYITCVYYYYSVWGEGSLQGHDQEVYPAGMHFARSLMTLLFTSPPPLPPPPLPPLLPLPPLPPPPLLKDLAARNVLVSKDEKCKVADFGLARVMKENVYEVQRVRESCSFPSASSSACLPTCLSSLPPPFLLLLLSPPFLFSHREVASQYAGQLQRRLPIVSSLQPVMSGALEC